MQKGPHKIRIPNPHGGQAIGGSLVKEILRQAGISLADWRNAWDSMPVSQYTEIVDAPSSATVPVGCPAHHGNSGGFDLAGVSFPK